MNKKFILTDETKKWFGYTLHRIKAVKDFGYIKAGDLGGWVESEENLSHDGTCWIYDDAYVYGYAKVSCDARVCYNAQVYGSAVVSGAATVKDSATVTGMAHVTDSSVVRDSAVVTGDAIVSGIAHISGHALVSGTAIVRGEAKVSGLARVYAGVAKRPDDVLCINGIGSRLDTTTVCRGDDDKLIVCCGCFLGTLDEFYAKVEKTHGDNKFGREYKALIELIKIHFEKETTNV